ncbi:hypothetical protein TNCV_3970371 [Trichonephila clavipes]|nr:hypothetical protein TNCV_3970371 [Trichonephila clavipes]
MPVIWQTWRLPGVHPEYSATASVRGSNGISVGQRERKGSPEHHFPPYEEHTANMRVGKPTVLVKHNKNVEIREDKTEYRKETKLTHYKMKKKPC